MRPVKQAGQTLVTALIILVMLMLLAVTAINMSSTNVQIAGNMQVHTEAVAAANKAIQNIINTTNFNANPFTLVPPTPQQFDVNQDGVMDYTVTFATPTCSSFRPVQAAPNLPTICYRSGAVPIDLCYWTVWDIQATAQDINTGATAVVHEGVNVLTGLNSALMYCN